jgi:methyl-accepting chemotaxis protein/cytochrome b561
MSSANPATEPTMERFHRVRQRLHWIIALLVMSQLGVALVMTELRSLQFGQWVIGLHRQIGLLLAVLLLTRIALSWKFPAPRQQVAGLPAWQRHLATAVHVIFGILLIVQPVIGVFYSWERGDSISVLGLVRIASPWDIPDQWHRRLQYAHTGVACLLLALVVLHVAAVVFNRYVRNAPVLERMLPARPSDQLVNRAPIGGQLAVGFGLLIATMLLAGLYSVAEYRQAAQRNMAIEEHDLAAAEETREAQVNWKELVGRANAQPLSAALDRPKELAAAATSKLTDALQHSPPGDLHTALEALLGKIRAATPAAGAWRPADLAAVDADLQSMVDSETANIFQLRTDNQERTARGHDLLVVAMVPTLVLGLLVSFLLSRSINGSLLRMGGLVRAVAEGRPDGALQVIGRGEFSGLMREMLAMRAAVQARAEAMLAQIQQVESGRARQAEEARGRAEAMLIQIQQVEAERARHAEEARLRGEAMHAQTQEVERERARQAEEARTREAAAEARDRQQREQQRSQLTAEFETRVAGIVASVARSSAKLKDMADSMASSARSTLTCNREASDMARRTSESAVAIAPSAEQLTAAASDLREHAQSSRQQALQVIKEAAETRTQVDTLVGAADQIGTIAETISTISRQTSLLAINARIQAALAGAEGKGFAVVATEVKELAAKTRNAVDEIGRHIERVTSVSDECAEFLQRLLKRIETLESAASGICRSADTQCSSTVHIARRITEVSASTQSVMQNIHSAQATASDTESMAAHMAQAAERMSQEALQLQDQVANFVLQIQGVGQRTEPAAPAAARRPAASDRNGQLLKATA